jgi:predicted butyrate kinase (DUF1464 family)
VIGIDPGTISIDLCGLEDGRVFLDSSLPTAHALQDPAAFVALLQSHAPVDLIVGPSGYGLPVKAARDLTDGDYRLAYLAAPGERGGIGGLRALVRALAGSSLPVTITPGVIHLASVPEHRKINRVDMGTADKVCATAQAIREYATHRRCSEREASFVLVELGGAFTAVLAVRNGQIVDGIAGSAGPLGARAAGALDAEVAYLAGTVSKQMVFEGGALSVAGSAPGDPAALTADAPRTRMATRALVESTAKAVMAAALSLRDVASRSRRLEVLVSGRLASIPAVRDALTRYLEPSTGAAGVSVLGGFAQTAKHAAQGAALIADGLAGGGAAPLVDAMGIREARGTLLDYLYVISPDAARARLGISS